MLGINTKYEILLALNIALSLSCNEDRSKVSLLSSEKMCNGLYLETFVKHEKGDASNLLSKWLTDSATFRIHLSTYDGNEDSLRIECRDKKIIVREISNAVRGEAHMILTTYYDVHDLTEKNNYAEK